jgi:eukaryotic translation initiation factor 2C
MDENNFSMDLIQNLTHSLCFGHQIVYSPTSLPTPVMVALEYAKRGRNIYNFWGSSGSGVAANGSTELNQLTEHLSFEKTIYLNKMRVNA